MSSQRDLFPLGSGFSSTAPIIVDNGEISLRDEFLSITLGGGGEVPKGIPLILRRVRRLPGGEKVSCVCLDLITKEATKDRPCPYCYGVGYLWDEIPFIGYKVLMVSSNEGGAEKVNAKLAPGEFLAPFVRVYLPWNIESNKGDQIIEVGLDEEGNPLSPLQRRRVLDIIVSRDLRADNGRLEYWVAFCQTSGPRSQGTIGELRL